MVLNEADKQKLRNYIEEQINALDDTDFQEQIKFDPSLLEQLLFKKGLRPTRNLSSIRNVKYPIWSGKFLSKIDLSQISFEDVCWDLGDFAIDYSNTNARIHLESPWEFYNCDFSGMDFSHTEIQASQVGTTFFNCNFYNTGLKIKVNEAEKLKQPFSVMFKEGYFDGCYLNDKLIDVAANKKHAEEILIEYNNMISQYLDVIDSAIQKSKK